jgi:hypothetical protein
MVFLRGAAQKVLPGDFSVILKNGNLVITIGKPIEKAKAIWRKFVPASRKASFAGTSYLVFRIIALATTHVRR